MSSSPWTLCVCVLTCLLSCSVPEDTQVRSGEDVLLLCQGPRGADIILVKWIRPDLETELYVFFFRAHRTYINYQHPYFRGRVKLRDPQRKEGDASVILENVTINDTGTYECHVRNKGNRSEFVSSVQLQVKDSDQQITVKTGDDVTLQCLDPRGGDIELLKWTRRDLEEDIIVCICGNMCKNPQDSIKNRVKLRDPDMKDGDVSVILKNVNMKDAGTYECHVRNNNTQPTLQLISNITLTVVDSGGGAGHTGDGGDHDERLRLIVALSVVTVLLVAAVVVVVVFMVYKKLKRKKKPEQRPAGHELQDLNPKRKRKTKEEEK